MLPLLLSLSSNSLTPLCHLAQNIPPPFVTEMYNILQLSTLLVEPLNMKTFVLQDGSSPLYIATSNAHLEVAKTLLEAGANANQGDKVCICSSQIVVVIPLQTILTSTLTSTHTSTYCKLTSTHSQEVCAEKEALHHYALPTKFTLTRSHNTM